MYEIGSQNNRAHECQIRSGILKLSKEELLLHQKSEKSVNCVIVEKHRVLSIFVKFILKGILLPIVGCKCA